VLSVPAPVQHTQVSLAGRWGRPVLQAMVLAKAAELADATVDVCWGKVSESASVAAGAGEFTCSAMHLAATGRGWFSCDLVSVTGAAAGDVLQYYVRASVGGNTLMYPQGVDPAGGSHLIHWTLSA